MFTVEVDDRILFDIKATSILILTAIQIEARAIALALGIGIGQEAARVPGARHPVAIRVVGMRAKELPRDMKGDDVACVVMAGFGGGLSPKLRVGDVVVEGAEKPARAEWFAGTIHTAGRLVSTVEEKGRLFVETRALAVDLEGGIVREWARAVPFVHLRVISDSASDGVDPVVMTLVDGQGKVRMGKLMGALVRRPKLLGELVRLGARARVAGRALGEAVRLFVEGI
jgi:adenosylhomocysteine nucleosidase